MKNNNTCKRIVRGVAVAAALVFAANHSNAQLIAYDAATNSTYNSGFSGNGGFGFGAWTLSTPGGGGYISGDTPRLFGLWNNGVLPGSSSTATRDFSSALAVGEAFTTSYINGHLNSSSEQEGFNLLDASGNILFSYWQQGGNTPDGDYLDANGADIATGFAYNFSQLNSYQFTLTGSTTYTFTDLSTLASFDGTLSGTVDKVQYFRESLAGDPQNGGGGGTDFKFFDMAITAVPEPSSIAIAALGGLGLLAIRRRSV